MDPLVSLASQLVGGRSGPGGQFGAVSQGEINQGPDHVATPPTHLSLYSALSRPKMSVSLTPSNTLGFRRPLTSLVKRSLTITNNNAQPIAFKVKTTAPKLYCVRPNSGRVEPGESQEVSVMLQALKEEPPLNAKCKDKFLIQSTVITPDKETMSLQEIWATTDTNEEGRVHQQKLRVTYLPAEGQTLEEEDETAHANMTSIISQSDSHNYDTVQQHPATNGAAPIPSAFTHTDAPQHEERPHTPPGDFSFAREESHEAHPPVVENHEVPVVSEPSHRAPSPPPPMPVPEPAPAPTVVTPTPQPAPAPAPVREEPRSKPAPAPAPVIVVEENPLNEQLLNENKVLKAELEKLKNELAVKFTQPPPVTELRQRRRRSSASETDVNTVVEDAPEVSQLQEGVPLNLVVAISFAVFFMTYIFF
ncbi:hypothetical protein D9611_009401 [Ephemerocybe angulata]|uniref:MSP domain-containing protein n=1 Tax=Ephemerocybe angulata TaxID=980116 RepID=A0A8H5AVE1_9AGAR|nr:hypothetical protein D9611_009401 [Tulosesus angulatus]